MQLSPYLQMSTTVFDHQFPSATRSPNARLSGHSHHILLPSASLALRGLDDRAAAYTGLNTGNRVGIKW
jgi:hypothetical protein